MLLAALSDLGDRIGRVVTRNFLAHQTAQPVC
jgi:hypothetical protein